MKLFVITDKAGSPIVLHTDETIQSAINTKNMHGIKHEKKSVHLDSLENTSGRKILGFVLKTKSSGTYLCGRYNKGKPTLSNTQPPRAYKSISNAQRGALFYEKHNGGIMGTFDIEAIIADKQKSKKAAGLPGVGGAS